MDTVFGSADRALVARDGTTTTVSAALADKAVVGLYFGPLVPPEPRLHPQACARLPEDQHREAVRGRFLSQAIGTKPRSATTQRKCRSSRCPMASANRGEG